MTVAGLGPSDGQGLDFTAGMDEENRAEWAATMRGEAAMLQRWFEGLVATRGVRHACAATKDFRGSMCVCVRRHLRAMVTRVMVTGDELGARYLGR